MKYIIALIFAFVLSMNAQTNISKISLDLGIIKNYQYDIGNDKLYSFYPELKIGGEFITKSLEWDLFTSYWNDGITDAFQIRDAATYSYSSLTFGSKVYFYPDKIIDDFFIPLYLTAGISYHKVYEKYVGGSDYVGHHKNDSRFKLITIDVGIGIYFQIFERLKLRIDTNVFIPFKDDDRLYNYGKNETLKLGFDYYFGN